MKIGILTQPLLNNYGGLLQNYALQLILKKLGHDPLTIDIIYDNDHLRKIMSITKRSMLRLIGKKVRINVRPNKIEREIISVNTQYFIKNSICRTHTIKKRIHNDELIKYNFDAFIVGSDQVWRPQYSPYLPNYFLDFVKDDNTYAKIAYAASFGIDDWSYSSAETNKYKQLIHKFKAVSVREESAIALCKKYFQLDVKRNVDPTLLLNKDDYIELFPTNDKQNKKNILYAYILDKDTTKNNILNKISQNIGKDIVFGMPNNLYSDYGWKNINSCVFPPIPQWIQGFYNADFVVTDSFHGTIFSIIFNKPFIAIANKTRGLDRFASLLSLFGLEERLIFSLDELNLKNLKEINWESVRRKLEKERNESMNFLQLNLSKI